MISGGRLSNWLHNHFVFSKAVLFIWGLVLSQSLVEYAVVNVMINYVTDTGAWKQSNMRKAAMVINLREGGKAALVVVVAHISEAYTGRFNMIILCTAAYVMGLMLLWVSASSGTEFDMFYLAMVLISLGQAGKDPPLQSFLELQISEEVKRRTEVNREASNVENEIDDERNDIRANIWWRSAWISGAAIATFFLGNASWEATFKVSALLMGASYVLFYFGFFCYHYEAPTGPSPLTSIYRVFKAAILKLNLRFPDSEEKYYWKNQKPNKRYLYQRKSGQLHLSPRVPSFLRFLDKAAIIREASNLSQERQEKKGELCTVQEVRRVKHLIPVGCMGSTFLAYSLVVAAASTYFVEQESNLNHHIGSFKVPVSFLFVLKSFVRDLVIFLFWRFGLEQQSITTLRIGAGMFCAVLCCITAWQVELHRLSLIKKEGVLLNPDKNISLSILVLTPQFSLLGLMEGLADAGLEKFFYNYVPKPFRNFGKSFSEILIGIGKFLSIPCALIFGSWFKETINTSKLDRYFLMLAILCSVSLCIYVYFCRYGNFMEDQQEDENIEPMHQTSEAIPEAAQDILESLPAPLSIIPGEIIDVIESLTTIVQP